MRNCIQSDAAEAWIKDANMAMIVSNGRRIGTRMRSMDGAILNDLSDLARHRAAELLVAKHLSYAHQKTIQRD